MSLIAAVGPNKEIGYQGSLPWKLSTDLAHFKSLTSQHTVIMGRKTFESIGKALPNRTNIVLTRDNSYAPDRCFVAHSFPGAISLVPFFESECFVIGGAEIYAVALAHATRMYLTQVDYSGPSDVYFPEFDPTRWEIVSEKTHPKSLHDQFSFKFIIYNKPG